MTNCKICGKDSGMKIICICGYCFDCIKQYGHEKCHEIEQEEKKQNDR
jgi:hypothetical protein